MSKNRWQDDLSFSDDDLADLQRSRERRAGAGQVGHTRRRAPSQPVRVTPAADTQQGARDAERAEAASGPLPEAVGARDDRGAKGNGREARVSGLLQALQGQGSRDYERSSPVPAGKQRSEGQGGRPADQAESIQSPAVPFPLASDLVAAPESGGRSARSSRGDVEFDADTEPGIGESPLRGTIEQELSGSDIYPVVVAPPPPVPAGQSSVHDDSGAEPSDMWVPVGVAGADSLEDAGIVTSAAPAPVVDSAAETQLPFLVPTASTTPAPPPPAPPQAPVAARPSQDDRNDEVIGADARPGAATMASDASANDRPSPPIPVADGPAASPDSAWFEQVFDDSYVRTVPFATAAHTRREADFIESALSLKHGSRILDLGCGAGRHCVELARRGYDVTGIDRSAVLLQRAEEACRSAGCQVRFRREDFRTLGGEGEYDAVTCLNTSFGYFDDDANRKMVQAISKVLAVGGRLLLDVVNRDYVVRDLPLRVGWEGDGCIILEEVEFRYFSSRINSKRSVVFTDGRHLEQQISIRVYSLHELGKLLYHAGFRVVDVSGHIAHRGYFFGDTSRSMLVVAEKRPSR